MSSVATACALALGVLTIGVSASVAGAKVTTMTCPVTVPNGNKPPQLVRKGLPPVPPSFHGNGRLWVKLWPLGVIVAKPNVVSPDGSIVIKLPWWRSVPGTLVAHATRLDGQQRLARIDVPSGYGRIGFQPMGITFPTQGCWRITGRVGSVRLSFIALIARASGNGY
jgi:hypothetical protein